MSTSQLAAHWVRLPDARGRMVLTQIWVNRALDAVPTTAVAPTAARIPRAYDGAADAIDRVSPRHR